MKMVKICIDPGHGGTQLLKGDSGAIGRAGTKEKDINLSVAKKLFELMKAESFDVKLTRSTDIALELQERVKIANEYEADYFISIHCNAVSSPDAHGTETYCYRFGGEGEKLAKAVQEEIVAATGLFNRGVKEGNFYVIRETKMPAILVELAFLSNPDEEKLLNEPAFQSKCAIAILRGVKKGVGAANNDVSSWAQEAWEWAKKNGIINGERPKDTATREEIVTMLYRFKEVIK
jgi:N-acetylmuramoyl-L-alanine amidase